MSEEVLEDYLIEQGVVHEPEYIKSVEDIRDFYSDNYRDMFSDLCGQGFYEDEMEVIVYASGKFHSVDILVNIESQKQDVGDRVYWADSIKEIYIEETVKPGKQEEYVYFKVNMKNLKEVVRLLETAGLDLELESRLN